MNVAIPSTTDLPFWPPPDVVLDLPVPPSVNRTRKVHWAGHRAYEAWKKTVGMHLVANGQYRTARKATKFVRYELTITLDETLCKLDPDNTAKAACDLLRSLELIPDDSPRFARRIVIEWGTAPDGCRLTLRPAA